MDIVSGRGNFFATTYALFGHSLAESKERFAENAELLDELWKGKPVHWSGRFRAAISGESPAAAARPGGEGRPVDRRRQLHASRSTWPPGSAGS